MIFVVLRSLDLKINYSIYFNSDLAIASSWKKKAVLEVKIHDFKKTPALLLNSIKFKVK